MDSDQAGQKAAKENSTLLADLFRFWGIVKHPGEPVSKAVARTQKELDDLAELIQAQEAAGLPTAQTEEDRLILWDHMWDLYTRDTGITAYTRATSADELAAAIVAEDNPILPQHGRIDYEAIKRRVDIVDYIGRHTELRQRGNRFLAKCPLLDHDDSTASFWVYPETKSFYCFGCHRGGDVIEYAKLRGIKLTDERGSS
jgi:hypothetical protein